MKLRNKISLIILVIWGAMATLFYYGSQQIILNSYLTLENQIAANNLERANSALNQLIDSVDLSVKDWSIWDDSYRFVQDNNQEFIKSTLALSSFQSIKMNIILFFDTNGKLVYSGAVNSDHTKMVDLPSGLMEQLTPKSKLVYQPNIDSGVKGLISIPSGILIIAAHSIINSQNKGPVRGTLIMARYLTNDVVAAIEKITRLDTTLYRIPQTTANNDIAHVYQYLLSGKEKKLVATDKKIDGYNFVNDINGNHIAILKIVMPRKIYQIGRETINYSNIIVLIYSVIITAIFWFLLQYLIVRRIEKLGRHLKATEINDRTAANAIATISDEVSSVAKLYHQATHDPLTGLANRNLLYQVFNDITQDFLDNNNQKIVIFLMNLDHFKKINTTLGHDAGDELLAEVAKRISSSLRDNDLAAHLNADEFAIMLVNVDKEQVADITSRIFSNINRPYNFHNRELVISFSVGISIYPDDGSTIDELLKQSDIALHHAKEHGRSRFQFYSESLLQTINNTHKKEIELQNAIVENQLCLYYQPIYSLRTKQINSFEALIRWNHPTKGLLGAGEIIPLAERTELIHTIGNWVLQNACQQIKTWKDRGLPVVPVAVNIAAAQMRQTVLRESIINTLQTVGLSPNLLEIEITETGFIDLTPELLKDLETLNASGIKLTIDDFGTGYAGLGYLKKLPVSKLKIDKSFIRDIKSDPDDKAITLAIIAIAHQLELQVTAEGVENLEQYNFLCYHQVDEVQGYFLSPPLSAENCEKLLSGEQPLPDPGSDSHE